MLLLHSVVKIRFYTRIVLITVAVNRPTYGPKLIFWLYWYSTMLILHISIVLLSFFCRPYFVYNTYKQKIILKRLNVANLLMSLWNKDFGTKDSTFGIFSIKILASKFRHQNSQVLRIFLHDKFHKIVAQVSPHELGEDIDIAELAAVNWSTQNFTKKCHQIFFTPNLHIFRFLAKIAIIVELPVNDK